MEGWKTCAPRARASTNDAMIAEMIQTRAVSEIELELLAYALEYDWVYQTAAKTIKNKNYFYSEKNRTIWGAMESLTLKSEAINAFTVFYEIENSAEPKVPLEFISEVSNRALIPSTRFMPTFPTEEEINFYAKTIAAEYISRYSIKNFMAAAEELKSKNKTPEKALEELAAKGALLGQDEKEKYTEEQFKNEILKGRSMAGCFHWGLEALDNGIKAIYPGSIIVVGARTSHGKTALTLQLMDAWLKQGQRIYLISTEMTEADLLYRRMSRISGMTITELERGLENSQCWTFPDFQTSMSNAFAELESNNRRLVVEERFGLTGEEISNKIKLAHKRLGINVFILDHFHDINQSGKNNKLKSMEDDLNLIVATCKNLNITAIIVAQLNRGSEHRDDHEPQLYDLRDLGKLEDIATNVLLLYWPYKKNLDESKKNLYQISNAKNRNGRIGKIYLEFFPETFLFAGSLTHDEWKEHTKR